MQEFVEVKTEKNIEKVAKLAETIWREHYGPILGDAQVNYMLACLQSKEAITEQIEQGTRYFLVREDGAKLGYFAVQEQDGALYLSKFYIVEWARGKGAGRRCLEYIRQLGRQCGKSRLVLNVNRDNERSIAAYKALGFALDKTEVTDIGGGFVMDDYVMSMTL